MAKVQILPYIIRRYNFFNRAFRNLHTVSRKDFVRVNSVFVCSAQLQTTRPFSKNIIMGSPQGMMEDPTRHLNYDQLVGKMKEDGTVVIDVRNREELAEQGVIPNTLNIPLPELEQALKTEPEQFSTTYKAAKPNLDAYIVFSCLSGRRSLSAMQTAIKLGYSNVANFKGGFKDWSANAGKN